MKRELTVALSAGLLAGIAVFLADPIALPQEGPTYQPEDGTDAPGPAVPVLDSAGLLWPFPEGPVGVADLLVLDPGKRLAGDWAILAEGHVARPLNSTPAIALVEVRPARTHCDAPCPSTPLAPRPIPEGAPRLLQDGHDAATLTIYVFDDVGSLLASNDDRENRSRFGVPGIALGEAAWHFGDGTPPNGTTRPPAQVGELLGTYLPLLEGLPEGGIRSARITDHPYAGLAGPIWVTARVDALHADA